MSSYPRLLPLVDHRWGLPYAWCAHADYDAGLRDMCDYGAARFREGYCDLVNFECMPVEVERIKDYMAKHHPDVAYSIGSPRLALTLAVAAWIAQQEPKP